MIHSKTAIHGKITKGKPKFTIKVVVTGDLDELNCDLDISKPAGIKKVEDLMEKQIEEGLKDLLVQSQAMNADFIGFGDVLRIDDKDSWKEIEDSWQSEI
ncbi:hypothetical protein EOC06_38815, partial [Mesorhizobium sp. M7A.F.Ca.MR.362.00.0.0]